MRHLFRTGSLFFVLAGISFLVVALKYLMTDNGSAGSSGALVATGVGGSSSGSRSEKRTPHEGTLRCRCCATQRRTRHRT
jgi:hypothetical protein